ncbi:MAG TPA: zf-HC2 domain-containing protein [Acidimicrobiia bacterium]|jgi:anti-sigma factor (TIGR02949 family)|nr:zf-HC2 domain-containing protein [Acidimicrobiia bacterium]
MRWPPDAFLKSVFPTGETPGPTTCFHVLSVIQVYADGECDVTTAVAIAEHLDHCPICRDELASFRWLKAAVRRCGGASRAPESRAWP